jgi:hypothetical protein
MKTITTIVIAIIISTLSFSQSNFIKGKILNKETKEGVAYTNIWVLNKEIGTSTSKNGEFILYIDSNIIRKEKLKITSVGYNDTTIEIKKIKSEIYLTPRIYEIKEVTVSPNKQNVLIINPIDKKMKLGYLLSSNIPVIFGRYFAFNENYSKTKYIKNIIIYTRKRLKSYNFNVHVYENDLVNLKPGKELINKNIVVTTKSSFGFGYAPNIIDISQYGLSFPDSGVIIGVEWIFANENKYEEDPNLDEKSKLEITKKHYGPDFMITYENKPITWQYFMGYWQLLNITPNNTICPAISITLTD